MRSFRSPRPMLPARRRGLAVVLAVALVAVQFLGLAHRIAHADRAALATAALSAALPDATKTVAVSPRGGAGWLSAAFAGHEPGHGCDAFDRRDPVPRIIAPARRLSSPSRAACAAGGAGVRGRTPARETAARPAP